MTLEIKLIIAALLLVGIGASYLWVYQQGQVNGAANEVKIQLAIRKQNQAEFQEQLQQDLQSAREQYNLQLKNEQKKAKAKEDAIQILKKQNATLQAALNTPLPDDLIGVYNGRISGFGQSESSPAKPASGADEALPAA